MLQAIEAEISPDGQVTLLEPVHLAQRSRALVTILAPIDETARKRGSAEALLQLLDSAEFVTAEPGDPDRMEREIAANRDAWGD
jgi:hypothetical protein